MTDRQIDIYLYIWFVGKGVVVSDGSQEHLYAYDEVLYNQGVFISVPQVSQQKSQLIPSLIEARGLCVD